MRSAASSDWYWQAPAAAKRGPAAENESVRQTPPQPTLRTGQPVAFCGKCDARIRSRPSRWCTSLSASSSSDVYAAAGMAITSSDSGDGVGERLRDRLDTHVPVTPAGLRASARLLGRTGSACTATGVSASTSGTSQRCGGPVSSVVRGCHTESASTAMPVYLMRPEQIEGVSHPWALRLTLAGQR